MPTLIENLHGLASRVGRELKSIKDVEVKHSASTAVGSTTQPVYVASDGTATATTYSLNKTVPADAKFTDTVTTATTSGSGNAVTAITASNGALAVTKGTTFLTEHQDISGKANLASPTFTGTPAAPTAAVGTNTTQLATTAFVQAAVSDLIDSAPDTLDTLNELSAALGDDPNFATTVSTNIGGKIAKVADATAGNVPVLASDGSLTDGGKTLGKSVPSDAVFTDTVTTVASTTGSGNAVTAITASNGALSVTKGTTFLTSHQDISGKQDASTAVTHTASTAVGSATQPVYVASDGKATATTYSLGKSVPANAVFTDTVTTASTTGSGNAVTAISASDGALTVTKGTTFLTSHQDISGKQDASTAVTHTASTAVGSATQPVYVASDGTATATTYTLAKSVPADALFTDTDTVTTIASTTGSGNAVTAITASNGALTVTKGTTFLTSHQDISGKQDASTAVTHAASTAAGSATQPVYVASDGKATATTYALNKTVPANAVFTDTVTTATTTGTGNAVTAITATDGALTVTKGTTFLTSHQDISGKANLASPTFTGTPAAPTAAAGTSTTQIATTAFVQTAVSSLVDSAPGTLDTLNELAAALGDDPNFATTVSTSIGGKIAKVSGATEGNVPVLASDGSLTDSGKTLGVSVPSDAIFTDTVTTVASTTGSGNAVTAISASNGALTVTKGTTFLTSHQDISGKANLASPTFTGTPSAPTAASGTNTTQLATTAFVQTAVSVLSAQVGSLSSIDFGQSFQDALEDTSD